MRTISGHFITLCFFHPPCPTTTLSRCFAEQIILIGDTGSNISQGLCLLTRPIPTWIGRTESSRTKDGSLGERRQYGPFPYIPSAMDVCPWFIPLADPRAGRRSGQGDARESEHRNYRQLPLPLPLLPTNRLAEQPNKISSDIKDHPS